MGSPSHHRQTTCIQVSSSHGKGCWGREGAPGHAEGQRATGGNSASQKRQKRAGVDGQAGAARRVPLPPRPRSRKTQSLGMSQSARGTLGPEWRGLQARRETGGGAEKCGCKGGELTDPGKAHALGRPLSLALSFLRPCPCRAALRAQRTAEPLPVTVAILAGGLPAAPCLSLPSPCSGAPQGLRSPGTTEAGRPRPKCQALW